MSSIDTIYIVGPTASGKTALSIDIAEAIGAEIVCADSQTIRRGMDIGTAKPSDAERRGVVHHMLDIIDPYDDFAMSEFQYRATNTIDDIHSRGKPAIIVGGTGLYIDSLYYDFCLPDLSKAEYRVDQLEQMSVPELQQIIAANSYGLPKNIQNKRHLINVILRTGNIGVMGSTSPASIIVGINPGRDTVVERINLRVEGMFTGGFVDEVRVILAKYGPPPKPFDALGYRIVYRHILGEITEDEAMELCRISERQYAKRQMSWFRRSPDIVWFDSPEAAKDYILSKV
jgi:tRNA dimethylallyltransferase